MISGHKDQRIRAKIFAKPSQGGVELQDLEDGSFGIVFMACLVRQGGLNHQEEWLSLRAKEADGSLSQVHKPQGSLSIRVVGKPVGEEKAQHRF